MSVDSFCRGIGVPLHPFPEPQAGQPSRYRPPGAMPEDAWVPLIARERATGREADLYDGKPMGNVIRALSLVPDEVRTLKDLSTAHYLPSDRVRDPSATRGAEPRADGAGGRTRLGAPPVLLLNARAFVPAPGEQ